MQIQSVKTDIRNIPAADLENLFQSNGYKAFRARQISKWLWKKGATSFGEMTDLPLGFRDEMDAKFEINCLSVTESYTSEDGTAKLLLRTHDGFLLESVLIPEGKHMTACVSTQCGCPLNCAFCATGKSGFHRNLDAGEIFDQYWQINALALSHFNFPVDHIVYMGMGEPFLNTSNTLRSANIICSEEGPALSPRRLTISTVGIPEGIHFLADSGIAVNLALSLHSAVKEKRESLIPLAKKHSLTDIISALKYYYKKTHRRFTIEYLLLSGINDQLQDARALALFCKNFPVKINLIGYNEVSGIPYKRTAVENVKQFAGFLEKSNLVVNIRKSRGADIAAACGQLAGKNNIKKNN